ncbi:MAG: 3-deoxy-manno-octulosonate cytidylyltransferase [Thermodesulfobacteriota bacterium]
MKDGKKIICIIPARLGSYRFRDKPFVNICGKPMIEHVYKRADMTDFLDGTYIATPDHEIKERVEAFGGKVIMTGNQHRRASERVAEAAMILGNDADIIINLQGDEPLVNPEMLRLAVESLIQDNSIVCVNLAKRVSQEYAEDRNEVKVVCDKKGYAMYFSRETIPSKWLGDKRFDCLVEVCVMPFTKESLQLYTSLEMTTLEEIESIDMLRWLEHGYRVKIIESPFETYSVDVPEDVKNVEKIMKNDPLLLKY